MALAATMVWEVETGGSDLNGGGFNPSETSAGTDYTYGAGQTMISWLASLGTYTNDLASTTGTKVISSASRNFVAADVGNVIHISAGTHFTAGWYEIKSVAANNATLDRDPTDGSTASAGSGYLGGALATPAMATSLIVGGNQVWIKSGTYTTTSASQNVSGGCCLISVGGTTAQPTKVEGYGSARGDLGTKPILTRGTGTPNYFYEANAAYTVLRNVTLNGASGGNFGYQDQYGESLIIGCLVENFTSVGIIGAGGNCYAVGCAVYNCQSGFEVGECYGCEAWGCSQYGFGYNNAVVNCIASGNATGFVCSAGTQMIFNCTAYGNSVDGFRITGNGVIILVNCYSEGNTGYGYNFNGVGNFMILDNCAGYSTGTGNYPATNVWAINFITLSGTAFVAAASGNFALNNNKGGLLKALAYPTTFPRGLTANYRDIGAPQSTFQAGTVG